MPEGWSWLFGHSLVLLKHKSHFPPLANIAYATTAISKQFPDSEMFLLDLWPGFHQSLIVCNSEAATQASIHLPKPPNSADSIRPIVGGHTIISMNGPEWKFWRALLNPGFSTQKMMGHVPFIVDCAEVFCEKLGEMAKKGEVFQLDESATKLTFDVIMKVTLDVEVGYQRREHVLPTAINTITAWHSFWDVRVLINPLRPIVQRYHGRKLEKFVGDEIQRRFEELKSKGRAGEPKTGKPKRAQSVISLALEGYLSDPKNKDAGNAAKLNPTFAKLVSNHIRLFLLAGNDTTSSTIVFAIHLMSTQPAAYEKLRAEHDAIFGPDPSRAAELLKKTPTLLNQCRYTLAFVKETLRLNPPAADQRLGHPDVSLPTLDGQLFPTKDLHVMIVHQAIHWNPRIWVRPKEFIPERWLVEPGHELYPPEGAFKAFDVGPRRCIGQELSLTEIKVVLVLTARVFGFATAYEEWDEIKRGRRGWWERMCGGKGEEMNTVNGSRVFQADSAGSHPSEGYPCQVEVLAQKAG